MIKKLMIIGAGGHAKVCLDIAKRIGSWTEIDFIDDKLYGELVNGTNVIGTLNMISKFKNTHNFIVAIGDNSIRLEIFNFLENNNYKITTLLDPSSIISLNSVIGCGTVIMPNVVINTNTIVGKNCIVNTGSIIEHDCVVGNHVHISPNSTICGTTTISQEVWIGSGSTVINNLKICSKVIIGAGSLVLSDIETRGVYYGSPVKKV